MSKISLFLVCFLLYLQSCYTIDILLGPNLFYIFGSDFFSYKSNSNNRKGSAPLITCDTIRLVANWYVDETCTPLITENMKPGDIVFVHRLLLEDFISYTSHITVPFILITSDADPDAMLSSHQDLLNNPNLALWATINCCQPNHPKAIPLPLGVYPGRKNKRVYEQAIALDNTQRNKPRSIFCIVNFTESTWTSIDRVRVIDNIKDFSFITFKRRVSREEYLENLNDSYFCICPRGNGWDCFRNWESMLVGAIPILEHNILDSLFYDLPVLIVDDFKLLTEDFLRLKLFEIKSKNYNYDKLYSFYWTDFLLSMQKKIQMGELIKKDLQEFKEKTYGIIER